MTDDFLCVTGFLSEDNEDDSLQYELEIPSELQERILAVMGWKTLADSNGNGWLLTSHQVSEIARIVEKRFPEGLDFFIEVLSST